MSEHFYASLESRGRAIRHDDDSTNKDRYPPPPPPPAPPPPTRVASAIIPPRAQTLAEKLDHACLHLTPGFFSINMGTGITSILLYKFPYPATWLHILGTIIFVLNVVIFVLLVLGNVVRYRRYKGLLGATLTHPVAGMFWGTLPMGLITIVNMIAYVCVPAWGYRWAQLALGLWWIDVILSVTVNLGVVFAMFIRQTHTPETMAATWLLPIVSSVVAAASGGIVASAIMPFNHSLATSTIVVSYVIWGTGVPLACFIIALWVYRTAIHGVPAAGALPSVFLPLGPCGQGSFGIILLGRTVRDLAYSHQVGLAISPISGNAKTSLLAIADAIYAGGIITGLILWGLGLCWYILATAIIVDHALQHPDFFHRSRFSNGFWAFTFPIGVFATSTNILSTELDSTAFKVIAAVLSVQVALNFVWVGGLTAVKVLDGTIFVAPELAQFGGRIPKRSGRHAGDVERQ